MILLLWLAIILAPFVLLLGYLWQLSAIDQYQYFPVLILAVAILFASRWDRNLRLPSRLGWIFGGISLGITAIAVVVWSPWLSCLAFLFGIGSFFASQKEREKDAWGLLALWPPCWLLLRLPLNLDLQLTTNLQSLTANISSYVLDLMGHSHRLTGNVFHLPKGALFVEDACSGVQSLFSLLFCATLLVCWQRRSVALLPLYLVTAAFWAGVMNIARVTIIAIGQEVLDMDLAHGWRHSVVGYVCLFGAIVMLISSDRLFRILFYPVPEDSESQGSNPLQAFWNRYLIGQAYTEISASKSKRSAHSEAKPIKPSWNPIRISPKLLAGIATVVLVAALLP